MYYCENVALLRHKSEITCTSAMCYHMDSLTKAMQCKPKHATNLKPVPVPLGVENLILLLILLGPLVCAKETGCLHQNTLHTE